MQAFCRVSSLECGDVLCRRRSSLARRRMLPEGLAQLRTRASFSASYTATDFSQGDAVNALICWQVPSIFASTCHETVWGHRRQLQSTCSQLVAMRQSRLVDARGGWRDTYDSPPLGPFYTAILTEWANVMLVARPMLSCGRRRQ